MEVVGRVEDRGLWLLNEGEGRLRRVLRVPRISTLPLPARIIQSKEAQFSLHRPLSPDTAQQPFFLIRECPCCAIYRPLVKRRMPYLHHGYLDPITTYLEGLLTFRYFGRCILH